MNNENKAPVRQTKFRGLRVDGKGRVYGGITSINHTPDGKTYIVSNEGYENDEENEKLVFIEVIPETIGQFTGKYTKSGSEIYEGDKLQQSKSCYWVVKWSDAECSWYCYQHVFSKDPDGEFTWKKSNAYPRGCPLFRLLDYNYEIIE